MVLFKPLRSFRIAMKYWWPRRLTKNLTAEPGKELYISAWLWWNYFS